MRYRLRIITLSGGEQFSLIDTEAADVHPLGAAGLHLAQVTTSPVHKPGELTGWCEDQGWIGKADEVGVTFRLTKAQAALFKLWHM